jgi:hypothetical protein
VPELLPPVKGNKMRRSKKDKKKEEDTLKKRNQQRRSTSDLTTMHRENGSLAARAQALAKQSATLRTINERAHEPELPQPRRKSLEYNGRPSIMLGADVSRAMRWADSFDRQPNPTETNIPYQRSRPEVSEPKTLPEPPKPVVKPVARPITPPKPIVLEKEPIQEIPREPIVLPKVQTSRVKSPEPIDLRKQSGPVLLSPEAALGKSPEKAKAPPATNAFKKFFSGGKSKEEKAAKRVSRTKSPVPPSPTLQHVRPVSPPSPPRPIASTPEPRSIPRTPEPRAPSPTPIIPETKEWEDSFDGTHNIESTATTAVPPLEDYEPAPPPTVPIAPPSFREEVSADRSDDEDLDRWAQIRKRAGQRALNRVISPPKEDDDEIVAVDIPRTRAQATSPTRRMKVVKSPAPEEEEEESVDARVARIRKRVQELTAGMGDD